MVIRNLLIASLGSLAAASAHAAPYSDLIVFGDSLSDVGNTSYWTAGIFPGSGYDDGRFTNGPVYSEWLSEGLGLGQLTRDGAGGDNFAYGGAETDGPGGFEGLFLNSLVEQVEEYLDRLDGQATDPAALFVVFIGANDLFAGQTEVATPAGVVQSQMEALIASGARQLLGVNLPLLGSTPDYLGDQAFSDLTRDYNEALAGVYSNLETTHADLTIHRLDAESLFSGLIANPESFGFTDTTTPGQSVAGNSLDRAPGHVFWDGVHPTREVHQLLAEAALQAVLPPGDFNRDGAVTEADFFVWRDAYGTRFEAATGLTPSLAADANLDGRVDASDYTVWRNAMAVVAVAVPEPTGLLTAVFALLGARLVRQFAAS